MRAQNEDRILVNDGLGLYVVADGMGGHNHGELAAQLAVEAIEAYVRASVNYQEITWPFGYDFQRSTNENRLSNAIRLASRRVFDRAREAPELDGMGTTVAAALVDDSVATLASIGDSRIYLFSNGGLQPLTQDDTWVGSMVRNGFMPESEVTRHPMRNILTQAAGVRPHIDLQLRELRLSPGDALLLSTDGLHGVVAPARVAEILAAGGEEKDVVVKLIEAARLEGAPDNVSCVLVRWRP